MSETINMPDRLRELIDRIRAAWQLAHGATAAEASVAAGYGSTAAFCRAFARAHGSPPSRHVGPFLIDGPNGIHFHPPAGLLVPGAPTRPGRHGLSDRMLAHHLDRTRELLHAAAAPRRRARAAVASGLSRRLLPRLTAEQDALAVLRRSVVPVPRCPGR